MQHLISALGPHVLVRRREFEAICKGDLDASGNYEFKGMAANLQSFDCNVEPITPDIVETLTCVDGANGYRALFAPGVLETSLVLGYLVHVPGHWVSVIPGGLGKPEHVGLICDSLYDCVFHVTGPELAEWLEAMAVKATERGGIQGVWSAYRVFR